MKVSAEELKLVMEDIAKMKLTSYKVKLIGYLSELWTYNIDFVCFHAGGDVTETEEKRRSHANKTLQTRK